MVSGAHLLLLRTFSWIGRIRQKPTCIYLTCLVSPTSRCNWLHLNPTGRCSRSRVAGSGRECKEDNGNGYMYRERPMGIFEREVVMMESDVDLDSGITSSYQDGVLTVRVPKLNLLQSAPVDTAGSLENKTVDG